MNTHIISSRQLKLATWIGGFLVMVITFLTYLPALSNGFVNWDDTLYILENSHIQTLNFQTIHWMLTTFHAGFWFPLTWFSHALDCVLWGLDARMHHLTSFLLHTFNALFVFLIVLRLVSKAHHGKPFHSFTSGSDISIQSLVVSGVTTLFFSLHPLRVESVVWAAERKDLLCAFFVLLSLLFYLSFTASACKKQCFLYFVLCFVSFIFSLMSKPMAVTLPLVMIILDYYPLRRIGHQTFKKILVTEKIPFFVCSVGVGILTLITQKSGGALRTIEELPMGVRVLNAARALLFYIIKMIWPLNLVPFYRLPSVINPFDEYYILALCFILGITGIGMRMVRRGKPLLLAVWMYYLVTLMPVAGIIQVGLHAVADRFTYLPGLSFSLLGGLGVGWFWGEWLLSKYRSFFRGMIIFCVLIIFFLMGYLTVRQEGVWKDSVTMWGAVIKSFPDSVPEAYYGIGLHYYEKGELDKAIKEFSHSLALSPTYAVVHAALGNAFLKKGMLEEAIIEYVRAIEMGCRRSDVHNNLGGCYGKKGDQVRAIEEFERALEIDPNFKEAYINLGITYYRMGRYEEAIKQYLKVLSLDAHLSSMHYYLSKAYYKTGNYPLALAHGTKALELGYPIEEKFLKLINCR